MRHPSTRAERRYVWIVARERYRNKLRAGIFRDGDCPENNRFWNRGGKQCEAHGNRCLHSLVDRYERRRQVKAYRRQAFAPLLEC